MPTYATVPDYELRTGTIVPPAQSPTVAQRLDDVSAIIALYLGDNAADVETAYPDILTMLTVSIVWRISSVPAGIRSESIGGTSVSYDTEVSNLGLLAADRALLDTLVNNVGAPVSAHGVGQYGVALGGDDGVKDDWPADVDVWVLSGPGWSR